MLSMRFLKRFLERHRLELSLRIVPSKVNAVENPYFRTEHDRPFITVTPNHISRVLAFYLLWVAAEY